MLLDAAKVPIQGASTRSFVPSGWLLEKEWKGDMDGDGRDDALVAVLAEERKDAQGEPIDRERALLALLAGADGRWRRVGTGDRGLQCHGCGGGMLNGTDWGLADIKIEKGIIVVDQIGGSRWTNASTLRFRYDSKEDRVSLIGADLSDFDRANGEETVTSTNYLTGDRIVTGRRIEEEGKGMRKVSEKRRKIAVPPIFLEEVDMYSLK